MGQAEQEMRNSISDLRKWFEKDAASFQPGEFILFWKSLSDEDKAEFLNADLGD
jgi:hypothetical protein